VRKTAVIQIEAEGRDQGKTFLITEMSAWQAERWALRALLAVFKSETAIPPDLLRGGIAAVAAMGPRVMLGIPYEQAEPLLAEMMGCVTIIPDPTRPQVTRALVESDVEEVLTLTHLKAEVFGLHVGFSSPAGIWSFLKEKAKALAGSVSTEMSQQGSARSSGRAKRR
jgi:hypothetical protein